MRGPKMSSRRSGAVFSCAVVWRGGHAAKGSWNNLNFPSARVSRASSVYSPPLGGLWGSFSPCLVSTLELFLPLSYSPPHARHQSSVETRHASSWPHNPGRSPTFRISHSHSPGRPSPRPRQIHLHRSHHARLDGRRAAIHAT